MQNVDDTWTLYGVEDGFIDTPVELMPTPDGRVWALGSHKGVAATAWLRNGKWQIVSHPRLCWGVRGSGYVTSEGALWVGAQPDAQIDRGQVGGVMRLLPDANPNTGWEHFTPPEAPAAAYGIGQTSDGTVWVGFSEGLRGFDGQAWRLPDSEPLKANAVDRIAVDSNGDLLVGSRFSGLFRQREGIWSNSSTQDGLPSNTIRSILPLDEDRIIVITAKGPSGFAQGQWRQGIFPQDIQPLGIKKTRSGVLWLTFEKTPFRTIRYRPDTLSPIVKITTGLKKVSSDGNTFVTWQGLDPWRITLEDELEYAWRLNDDPWSKYTSQKEKVFSSLPSGNHRFEIKSRDRDFNETVIPSILQFTVAPPVWREPWFVGVASIAVTLIGLQTTRVIRRDKRLSTANQTLENQLGEIRKAQEDAEKARNEAEQANRAKSTFLANMSHEIRTPMNAVIGYSELLIEESKELNLGTFTTDLHKIQSAGSHLLSLINDILDLSKIEAGREELNFEDFDLAKMVEELSTMFELRCRRQGLDWKIVTDLDRAQVRGDGKKLRQILVNLLGNAVKFTEEGKVELNIERRGEDRFYFQVADTGPGIPPEDQQAIFEPFQQEAAGVSKGGTGLGLAISHRFTEMMGGVLAVESMPGEGTHFSFELNLLPAVVKAVEDGRCQWARVRRLAPGCEVRALVVDDVAENREILERVLKRIGVDVALAADGLEAVEAVRRREPAILFLDIRMPGIDGVETLQRIVAGHGDQAFKKVAVTASALVHQRQQYLDAGFDDHVNKPFYKEEIYAVLAKLLSVEFEYAEESTSAEGASGELEGRP